MKKTVSVLLIIAMMLAAILAITSINAIEDDAPEMSEAGEGAIQINSMSDYLKVILGGETEGKEYSLNIDVYDTPLSNFKGTLYGNGHTFSVSAVGFDGNTGATIKDLKIVSRSSSTIFGALNGVTLENITIDAKNGAVASSVTDSTLKNVKITMAKAGSSVFGSSIVNSKLNGVDVIVNDEKVITASGNFGALTNTLENSTLDTVTCDYPISVSYIKAYTGAIGGIAAFAKGEVTFENVSHLSYIHVNAWATYADGVYEKTDIGGLIGQTIEDSKIVMNNCQNFGDMYATQTATNFGGMIGKVYCTDVIMYNCKNNANIMSCADTTDVHVGIGGIIGWTRSKGSYTISLNGCENYGTIKDTPHELIFAAFCEVSAIIYNNEHKNDEDFEAVDAEGYKDIYIEEYENEYFAKPENFGKEPVEALNQCMAQSQFHSKGQMYAGGMLGRTFAIPSLYLNGCKNFADVTISSSASNWGGAGGMVAAFVTVGNWEGVVAADITVLNCYNEGTITAMSPGGIIGGRFMQFTSLASKLMVKYCVNNGELISREGGRAGGIVCDFDSLGGDNSCKMSDITIKNCANYANISGATIAGGIVASYNNDIHEPKAMVITDCYNSGEISTINDLTTINAGTPEEEVVIKYESISAGIIGITNEVACISGCVNEGKMISETEANAFAIVSDAANVIAENNVHSGEGEFAYSQAKTDAEIADIVKNMVFAGRNNTSSLARTLSAAMVLVDIDYTAESWEPVAKAIAAAKVVVSNDFIEQHVIDELEANLKAAMEQLVQQFVNLAGLDRKIAEGLKYKKSDWDDYSFMNLTNAIEAAVIIRNTDGVYASQVDSAMKAITDAIANLEERGEMHTLATVTDLVVEDLYGTGSATQAATGDVTEEQGTDSETEIVEDQGGCGGIIGGAAVVLVAAVAVGVGLSFKKKED